MSYTEKSFEKIKEAIRAAAEASMRLVNKDFRVILKNPSGTPIKLKEEDLQAFTDEEYNKVLIIKF